MTENTMHAYRTFGRRQTNVYIVSKDRLAEAESVRQEQDVIILDDRASADPNMQIRQSYKITRWADRAAILRILLEYNAEHPETPGWNRSFGSMMREWILHNIAYRMGIQPGRTGDVDFNNGDEGKRLMDYMGSL